MYFILLLILAFCMSMLSYEFIYTHYLHLLKRKNYKIIFLYTVMNFFGLLTCIDITNIIATLNIINILICLGFISTMDFYTKKIPNNLNTLLFLFTIAQLFIKNVIFIDHFLAFIIFGFILTVVFFISNDFGFGDVKLIAICALLLGGKQITIALIIACLLFVFSTAILHGKKRRTAFGPYICIGTIFAMSNIL